MNENNVVPQEKKKTGFKLPHTLVLLFMMTIIMAILTWIIPAGEFQREVVNGRTIVIPGSYQHVARQPQGIFETLLAISAGFEQTQDIIYFLFVAGGAFNILNATGMMEANIEKITIALKGKEKLIIPIIMFVMAVAGSTIGLSEEGLVLLPIGIALARGLGYDAVVGIAIIQLGSQIGFNAGIMNPFSTGVAQQISELPLFSGAGFRIIVFLVYWVVTSAMVIHYAEKVKTDPSKSVVPDLEAEARREHMKQGLDEKEVKYTAQHLIITIVFVLSFVLIAWGVFTSGWFIAEIGSIFLGMGLLSGLIARIPLNKLGELFVDGAKDMVFAGLAVSIARSVLVVMDNGMILDTIVNALSSIVGLVPSFLATIGMFVIQVLINFIIPSGSGQAAATMPIMIPLADAVGVTRQTAVLAYQFGAGFMDSVIPTSGVLMGLLAIAKVPYDRWMKFFTPIITVQMILACVFLLIAHFIGYGPF